MDEGNVAFRFGQGVRFENRAGLGIGVSAINAGRWSVLDPGKKGCTEMLDGMQVYTAQSGGVGSVDGFWRGLRTSKQWD
jgi:hypothetical protein